MLKYRVFFVVYNMFLYGVYCKGWLGKAGEV